VEKGLAERILRSARWARSAITSGLPPVPTAGGRALATRIAGMLLLAGAVLIVVTVALPPAAGGSDLLILAYGVIAGAVGTVLVARRRVSEPVLGAVAALGTAVITLATLEAGAGTGAEDNEVLYLWVSLFCFWFFGLRHALLQLALIGIADAVLLIDQSPMFAAGVTRWVVTVSTLAVTGLLGAWLRRSLEREREEAARLAVVAERMRIAREVHDAAGHGVTAVSIQAAAGLRSLDSDTEATREALEEIERTSRVTMEDMRRLLGILRPGTEGEAQLDRVSLAGVNTLIEEVERAGLPVALEVSGKRSPLPTALDQAAYRIAQGAHQCPQARGPRSQGRAQPHLRAREPGARDHRRWGRERRRASARHEEGPDRDAGESGDVRRSVRSRPPPGRRVQGPGATAARRTHRRRSDGGLIRWQV